MVRRQTLGDLLRRTRQRFPNKPAIRCGATTWTYAQFDDVCNRLAGGFAAEGVELGDRVAILARNSHAFAAVRFALARIGAVLVPINFMLTAPEARFILEHSGAKLLCVDSAFAELGKAASDVPLVWLPGEEPSTPPAAMKTFDALLDRGAKPPERELHGSLLAQIIYTSGTEARPKGAMLTHEAVIAEYVTCLVDAEIAENDVVLHALPLYHCAQLDVFFGPCVYVGATNIITGRPAADRVDLAPAIAVIRRQRPVGARQGLLRRIDHACGGAERDAAAPAEGASLELVRSDRDSACRDGAETRGPAAQGRLRWTPRAERRDPGGRRQHERRRSGGGGRDRPPFAAAPARLLPRRRADAQ